MDPNMSVLFMLCISFPEALLVSYFVVQFMSGRPKIIEILLIALIQMVVAYTVRNLPIPVGLHTILQGISLSILIFLISRISILASIIGTITVYIISLFNEIIVVNLMLRLTGWNLQDVVSDPYRRIYFTVPIFAMMLLIILIIKRYKITFLRVTGWQAFRPNLQDGLGSEILYRQYLPAVVFIFLPIILLFILNFAYVSVEVSAKSTYHSNFFKTLFNSLIIFLVFMSVWSLGRLKRSIEKEYEATQAAHTISQLKELILSIRKQRHDFNHHLQTVYGLIETGAYKDARDYIKNTYHYVASTGEIIKTDHPGVSALLYAKIGIAETRNIKLDINIECSLEELPLRGTEESSLLGNLIDNAIDAVEKSLADKRDVRVDINAERGEYVIKVANRGEPLDPAMAEKIFDHSFTTKEGHAGLGLAIVKEIVEKYNGGVRTYHENQETVFEVRIPVKR